MFDYSAVFDAVSHKFMDKTPGNAGVSWKIYVIFRIIYSVTADSKGERNKWTNDLFRSIQNMTCSDRR